MYARQVGTCGNRSFRRFDFVRKMIIAILRPVKFLLVFDTLIHGKKNVEFGCLRRCNKVAIFQSGQSSVTGCLAIVLRQRVPESLIDTFVDQNAHLWT